MCSIRTGLDFYLKKFTFTVMKKYGLLFLLLLPLVGCADKDAEYIDPRGTDYAGSQSCIQCHKQTSESARMHAHFTATAPGTVDNILGNFTPGHNTFEYDQNVKISIEKRGDSVFHVVYKNGKEQKAYPVGIVFGSKNAQTPVYWNNHNTFELPLSYYKSVNNWGTSPGFSSTQPYFERKVVKDCYACHSSNSSGRLVTGQSDKVNFMTEDYEDAIDPKTIVFGIDCERCHGPAQKHVSFHLKYPDVKTANFITKFSTLTNAQKIEACAICHSGTKGVKIKSTFSFKPGDKMSDFYLKKAYDSYDVHGNQYGMLTQSKCFSVSKTMTCTTCHDPHQDKRQAPADFAPVCTSCHETIAHTGGTLKTIQSKRWEHDCVECHMPKQPSQAIIFQQYKNSEFSKYLLRSHRIAVYQTKAP